MERTSVHFFLFSLLFFLLFLFFFFCVLIFSSRLGYQLKRIQSQYRDEKLIEKVKGVRGKKKGNGVESLIFIYVFHILNIHNLGEKIDEWTGPPFL